MVSNKLKRCLSLMIAFALSLSLVPTWVLASETGTGSQPQETETAAVETARKVQARMQAILTQYGVTSDMGDDEIANAIIAVDGETLEATMQEIEEIESLLTEFDDGDEPLFDMELLETYERFCQNLQHLMMPALLADLGTILNGQISITATYVNSDSNGQGKCSISGNTVTIQSNGDKGLTDSRKEQVVTLTNETTSKATLYFDYKITSGKYEYIKINDVSKTSDGYFSGQLDPGGSMTIKTKGKKTGILGSLPAPLVLTLNGFSLTPVAETSNVTVEFDSSLGGVTVGNTPVSSGYVETGITEGSSITLVAAPANDTIKFCGWINAADGRILYEDPTYTLTPTNDMTVKAIFVGAESSYFAIGPTTSATWKNGFLSSATNTYYTVSTNYIYEGLTAAATAAAASETNKVVFPLSNATLTSGDYTIPSGVTLLIPYDTTTNNTHTMYTTIPREGESEASYVTPTAYRTLTLASGANLVIEGSMSISARINYAANKVNEASPTGPVGFVNMEDGSTITVGNNDGSKAAKLYAWGYITGSGQVTVHSGASVYECFQFMGYRGGDQSTSMADGVFPISQYYVQNIEVPLTLNYGAREYAYTVVYASSMVVGSTVNFVGPSGCMFTLTSGSLTKRYDGSTDRLIIDVEGNWSLSAVKLTLAASLGSAGSIDSADYVMPINNNITINVGTGTATVNQDLALLPGTQLNVSSGATISLASGKRIYVYDADNWGNFVYTESFGSTLPNNRQVAYYVPFQALYYAPGRQSGVNRHDQALTDASVCVNGTIDASAGYIYTTASGADVYSTGAGVVKLTPGTETNTYQLVQNTGNTAIPITPEKLKNADGSYVETAGNGTMTYEYVRVDNKDGTDVKGHWHTTATVNDTRYRICKFASTNIAVNDGLDLYFYVYEACLNDGASYTATVTKKFADGRADVVKTYSSTAWETKSDTVGIAYKYFGFDDISAKEMTDNITAVIKIGSSETEFASYSETIQNYAIRTLAQKTTTDALKTALVDMLNYGADAQKFFTYNAADANLANVEPSGIDEKYKGVLESNLEHATDEAKVPTDYVQNPGTNLKAISVSAKNKMMLSFYFDFGDGASSIEGYTAEVTYEDSKGNMYTLPDSALIGVPANGNYYYVDVMNLSMTKGRYPVTCTVKNGDATVAEGTFSVAGYVALNKDSTDSVYESLLKFIDSASAYFATQSGST
ncbi:MAG: hypothetical protein IJ422_03765 [Oscillospiraceae bacterium]|nr:hypothetical protein [Oscillospiraceae bacterium]